MITARLLLRSTSDKRTMVTGVLLADVCADHHERIVQCTIQVFQPSVFRANDAAMRACAGKPLGQLGLALLGLEYPNTDWPQDAEGHARAALDPFGLG